METLTDRQNREIEYHREFARKYDHLANEPIDVSVCTSNQRRWWNAYWHTYTLLRRLDLKGKSILVPGCGFGGDAVRLASMGASVKAFDISAEIIDVTRRRLKNLNIENVELSVMPSEELKYPDNTFDIVLFLDILHHVDIPKTMAEVKRVLKPNARVIGDELYTHSFVQKYFRESALIERVLYKRMQKFIYRSNQPYITEDEHKIDETEFHYITESCTDLDITYFNILLGRLVPDRWNFVAMSDRALSLALGPLGRFIAGRIVFTGRISK